MNFFYNFNNCYGLNAKRWQQASVAAQSASIGKPRICPNLGNDCDSGRSFQADYHFSPEELKALRECNQESFVQRSLPFGTGLGLLAYFGVKNGYLQGNGKYGAVPKVIMGVILGYFVGKFSYQQKCAEKIMRLPNSRLGELLRQRRQGGGVISTITPDENLGRAFTLAPFTPSSADVYTDEGYQPSRNTALNLDTDSRPNLSGLDDIYRPTLDCAFGKKCILFILYN